MIKTNYHTHTPRCKHASGAEWEYCEKAIEKGYRVLGFTDHTAWPYEDDYTPTYHMTVDQLDGYIAAVNRVKADYADRLEVHLGLECEHFPAKMRWLADMKREKGIEYLILGNHFDTTDVGGFAFGNCTEPEHIRRYVKMCVSGLETGLFTYFAHPDLCFRHYLTFDEHCVQAARELCRASKALDVPLEYNLLGSINCRKDGEQYLHYPCPRFWEVAAEENVNCIIGTDAHSPDRFDDDAAWENAAAYLEGLGLRRLTSVTFK